MTDVITKAQLSPGIYVDTEEPGLIAIDPVQILSAQDMEADNLLEARIFETLRKQYVALGYRVVLLTDEEPESDADSIDESKD